MTIRSITWALVFALSIAATLQAQAPGVPIVREGHGPAPQLFEAARMLREANKLLPIDTIKEKLGVSAPCRLELPRPRKKALTGSEIWNVACKAHLRLGYNFLCNKCNNWHLDLAGGYAITADGAVVTCFHVVEPKDNMREGYLVAVSEDNAVMPVTAVLASNKFTDICILRVQSDKLFEPLPLNPSVTPGDPVWCYSDPADHRGFFSTGIVNRFYQHTHGPDAKEKWPLRVNVSTEWAPGSSGAAVLDRFGNAVAHVSAITPQTDHPRPGTPTDANHGAEKTVLVYHDAVCAVDVLALVKH